MSGRIDVHHHQFNDRYRRALAEHSYDNVGGIPAPAWNPGIALEQMGPNGIDAAILSISAPGVHFGNDAEARSLARHCNDWSAGACSDGAGRFGFFAVLPMPDVDGSIAEIGHAFDVLGADGIVLMSSHLDGTYLGDARFDPVMAELDRRGAVVFVHPQVPTTGVAPNVQIPVFAMDFTFDTTRAAFNMVFNGTIERYPNIRFVLAHAGGTVPYLAWRFGLLWAPGSDLASRAPKGAMHYLRSFWYDTALSATPQALGSLLQLVGPDRILFGSDFPFAPEPITRASVAGIERSELLDDDARAAIERESALALFPRFG